MKLKNIGKNILAMALATTMALSAPMAVFATESQEWELFVGEVATLLTKSREEVATEINKLQEGDDSKLQKSYEFLETEDQALFSALTAKSKLDLDKVKALVNVITDGSTVKDTHLQKDKLISLLTEKKSEIISKIGEGNVSEVKRLLSTFNTVRSGLEFASPKFLVYNEGKFVVENSDRLDTLVSLVKGQVNDPAMQALVTSERFIELMGKFNEKATSAMKADALIVANKYNLLVDTITPEPEIPEPETPTTPGGGGGGGGESVSQNAQKDIAAILKDTDKKDIATVTEDILKNIEKLDAAGAKAVAGPVINMMTDLLKKAEGTSIKEAQDAMVTLVQALVSRVTTQEVEVKDGKATLSTSKLKEQIKDAQDIIKQLDQELEKKEIQVTKTIKITLNFELNKEISDVEVIIPEGLWKAIDQKANIAVKAKDVELILEYNTFAEEIYTINIKEVNGVVELTTNGTFVNPIVVTFPVAKNIRSYPTVFQVIEGKNKLVGGIYSAETIKVSLKHFSFYTVEESAPKGFTDISGLTWEKKAVNELSARGYLAGMTENTFAPNANTTRAEFAAMLTRVLPVAEVDGTLTFTDLKEDAWYYKSIATAVNQGWLVGRDSNKFDPAAPVTRQEVASVLSRVLEQNGYLQTANIEEGVNVSAWAKDAVSLYLREVETEEVTKLDMSQAATRAELATMIYELITK